MVGGGYYPVTHAHSACVYVAYNIRVCVCVCVYNISERDWHAIEINRCGYVMATISNIRGGSYCQIDCSFSPLSFFFFFLSYDYNEHYRVRENSSERKEAGARYLCGRSSAL